jgi:lysophospholipase L1-like esterase
VERLCHPLAPWTPAAMRQSVTLWRQVSPLQVIASNFVRVFQDGRILPNPYLGQVVPRTLSGGQPILFYPYEVESGYRPRDTAAPLQLWRELARQLATRNLRLAVVLVPNKYTVYYPYLQDEPRPPPGGLAYLSALEQGLRADAIPAINLGNVFPAEAKREYEAGNLIYWRDDTHWNARGIQIAAATVAARLRLGSPSQQGRAPP